MDFSYLLTYILKYPEEQQNINDIIGVKENLKKFTPLIFNRYLSFHFDNNVKNISFLMNRYLFKIKDAAILFSLMCNMTPSVQKTYIQYKSKNKKDEKYTDSIIKIFKKFYGEHFNIDEIVEILEFVYKNDKMEFIKVCLYGGMTTPDITKTFPETEEYIENVKLDATEKKKFVKFLKDNKKIKICNKKDVSDLDIIL